MKLHLIKISCAAIVLISGTCMLNAQNASSAIALSQRHYEGSARSAAMGNAFTGLGGEIGAIDINPAGAGMYRYSEFIITPAIGSAFGNSEYISEGTRTNLTRFSVPNAGFIIPFNTGRSSGLVNFNIGLVLNRTDDYTYSMGASGLNGSNSMLAVEALNASGIHYSHLDITEDYNPFYEPNLSWRTILFKNAQLISSLGNPENPDDPNNSIYKGATENISGTDILFGGPVYQNYRNYVRGSKSQVDINFSGNISNIVFWGFNLGFENVQYSYYESYEEIAENPRNFDDGFDNFKYVNRYSTSGVGFNMNFGVIVKPVKWLSVGAAISTPTWFTLTDNYDQGIRSSLAETENLGAFDATIWSPLGEFDYRLNTPFRWSLGAAFILGNRFVASVDYESLNYSHTRLIDPYYSDTFTRNNKALKKYCRRTDNLRVGAEFRVSPVFSVRGGYNYYDYVTENMEDVLPSEDIEKIEEVPALHVASIGAGFNFRSGFFIDVAYQHFFGKKESFYLYQGSADGIDMSSPLVTGRSWKFKVLLSLGFRF